MVVDDSHHDQQQQQELLLDLKQLTAVSVLGRGAKGVVFLVKQPQENNKAASVAVESLFALKAISRSSIEKKNNNNLAGRGNVEEKEKKSSRSSAGSAYRRIWLERDVLLTLRHPLLPSLRGVVSTDKIVGFVIDRCSGGDLSSLRRRQTEKMFSDDIIRFYAAELVLALEYLHGLGIVYRDLKPENIMIQDSGHIMLVDFDLSTKLISPSLVLHLGDKITETQNQRPYRTQKQKQKPKQKRFLNCFSFSPAEISPASVTDGNSTAGGSGGEKRNRTSSGTKSNSFVGTEDYVAPEMIRSDGHDFAVDWWSLGIVMYEMLYGRTPFRGINRKETFYKILTANPELAGEQTPLRDLIAKLLEKDPNRRMKLTEIKRHPFFKGVHWDSIIYITRPPYIPETEINGIDVTEIDGIDVEKTVHEIFESREKEKVSTTTDSGVFKEF